MINGSSSLSVSMCLRTTSTCVHSLKSRAPWGSVKREWWGRTSRTTWASSVNTERAAVNTANTRCPSVNCRYNPLLLLVVRTTWHSIHYLYQKYTQHGTQFTTYTRSTHNMALNSLLIPEVHTTWLSIHYLYQKYTQHGTQFTNYTRSTHNMAVNSLLIPEVHTTWPSINYFYQKYTTRPSMNYFFTELHTTWPSMNCCVHGVFCLTVSETQGNGVSSVPCCMSEPLLTLPSGEEQGRVTPVTPGLQ